jgi:hypothetical protein
MSYKIKLLVGITVVLFLAAACSAEPADEPMGDMQTDSMMDMGMDRDNGQVTQQYAPLVDGFYEGGELLFIHTEASDPDVANMLTEMMAGPLVVWVPALADAPPTLLAQVYVFTNGVDGHGPFGFQADIFDSVPGDEGYRPLRSVNLVNWHEGTAPRELRSVAELEEAEAKDEVTITQPGIVVNMPILVWPDGSR